MISVIVPVYNVELYLKRCLDSLINQTYKDFEIILVNDGSTDSSPILCDEYAEKNAFITVIHQKNAGLSVARNNGVSNAKGDYVTFIDSDDLVDSDYLSILYNLLINNNAELSCCSYKTFSCEDELEKINKTNSVECFTGSEAMQYMFYGKIHGTSACAILLKREIVLKYNFTPGKYHEDDLVSFKYFYNSSKVVYTSSELYFYYQRTGSIMHGNYGKAELDELDAGDYVASECKKYGKKEYRAALYKKYSNYYDVIKRFPELKEIDNDSYVRIVQELPLLARSISSNVNICFSVRIAAFIISVFGYKGFITIKTILGKFRR